MNKLEDNHRPPRFVPIGVHKTFEDYETAYNSKIYTHSALNFQKFLFSQLWMEVTLDLFHYTHIFTKASQPKKVETCEVKQPN